MANPKQLADAFELRKKDPTLSVRDAVSQVRNSTIANAPIAGTPPPITPTPTAPVTPPPIEAKVGDTVIGVGGEKFVQANNKDMTTTPSATPQVVNSPIVPPVGQPIPTVTPPPLDNTPVKAKDTPIVDKNAEIKAKNEAQLALNKQGADLRQAERDKVTADANSQMANSESSILNALKTGLSIPEVVKSNPNYAKAKETHDKVLQYSSYSVNELTTALTSGAILPGTSLYNEMMRDPLLKKKITDAQVFTGITPVNQNEVFLQKSNEILSSNPITANFLSDGVITQEEYSNATNNVEVVAKAKEVEEKSNKYNALYAEFESIPDKVRADFPASPFADDIIADRQNAMRQRLTLAKGEVDTAIGTLTELKGSATKLFETNLGLYKDRLKNTQDQQMEVIKSRLGVQEYGDKAGIDVQKGQALFDQKLAQEAQIASDPVQAVKSVVKTFADMGIVADRTESEMIADIQTKIASGMTLGQATSELQKQFKSKPEYQKMLDLNMGKLSDAQKMTLGYQQDLNKMAIGNQYANNNDLRNFEQQKEIARMNNDYNRQDYLFQLENDPAKRLAMIEIEEKLNANKSLFDVLGKNVGTYEGNRGYDLAGKLGDPMPAGGNWTVKSVDQAGELGVPYIAGTKKPYGNTVVMVDENGNEVRYSHLETIGVKPGDKLGFGEIVGTRGNTGNVKGANGETLTADQLAQGRGAHLDIEIKDTSGKLLSQSEQVEWLKSKKSGATTALGDKQFTQYNQTKTGFKSEPIVKSFEEALIAGGDIIQSLGSANGPGDVGAVFNFMKSLDPTSTVREGEFALAAKSAGVWESFKNIPANKLEGTILTDSQRKDFGKLAMKYIESKGKLYDTKYDDMTKVLKNQGIPESYYPTRMTDYVKQYKGESQPDISVTPTTSNIPPKVYSSFEDDFATL